MRDLAMHILDLAQNSLAAEAHHVKVQIEEDGTKDRLNICIADDGRGMDAARVAEIRDPFVTSRTTRKVGLGIPLAEMTAQRCGGDLQIESAVGQGTVVTVTFGLRHLDRPPLGDLESTILGLIVANPDADILFRYIVNQHEFVIDSAEIKQQLDGLPLTHPEVLKWLQEYIGEGLRNVRGGAVGENSGRFEALAGATAGPN